MILRWLITFSVLLAPAVAASIAGRVQITGAKPGVRTAAGVVLWLTPEDGRTAPSQPLSARMEQHHKQFLPHVLAVPVGSTVDFPNLDPIFHNAFSNIDGKPFDLGLYPPGSSRRVVLNRAGIVRVFCNIHQSMSAVIVVVDTPWIALSADSGAYRFTGVPPGRYRLHVFYERARQSELDALSRVVDVSADSVELPLIAVSEIGYIEVPHRNKYGQEYPPAGAGYGTHEANP
jgi:plastocyanin